jgi:predicted nucleic acid-binding protein
MPERQRVVVDTSCLIALSALSLLDVLEDFYEHVVVPVAVAEEFGEPLPDWMTAAQGNPLVVAALRESLGHGEAEVIAVAAQSAESLAVLDDQHARAVARAMGVQITGTLGILLRAKRDGALASISSALEVLERVGFHMSSELMARVRALAGE